MSAQDQLQSRGTRRGEDRVDQYAVTASAGFSQQVRMEIDELVLTGFTRSQGEEIADSLRETLTHLFEGGVARWSGSESVDVDALDAGKVQLRRPSRARSAGERIARAIYGSLPR